MHGGEQNIRRIAEISVFHAYISPPITRSHNLFPTNIIKDNEMADRCPTRKTLGPRAGEPRRVRLGNGRPTGLYEG